MTAMRWAACALLALRARALSSTRGLAASGLLEAPGCAGIDCVRRYVAEPDAAFAWRDTGARISGVDSETGTPWTGRVLNVTSQRWLTEAEISHPLLWNIMVVVEPQAALDSTDFAVVNLGFGYYDAGLEEPHGPSPRMGSGQEGHHIANRRTGDDPLLSDEVEINADNLAEQLPKLRSAAAAVAHVAVRARAMGACVLQVVNGYETFADDPLHKRRAQDTLRAYTYQRFLKDTSRPEVLLELAMTKAVVRALDAVSEFSEGRVRRFGLMGYSKLGTATYMAAAVDPRVTAIAPGSIYLALADLAEQPPEVAAAAQSPPQSRDADLARQLVQTVDPAVIQAMTDMSAEYIEVLKTMGNPEYEALSAIVDPLRWSAKLDLPKYIVMSSDDTILGVQPSLAMREELGRLPGPTSFAQLPNCDHENTHLCSLGSVAAFFRGHLLGRTAPRLEWTNLPVNGSRASGPVRVAVAGGEAAAPRALRAQRWGGLVSSQFLVSYTTFEPEELGIAGSVEARAGPPAGAGPGEVHAAFVTVDLEWPEPGYALRLSTPMWFASA